MAHIRHDLEFAFKLYAKRLGRSFRHPVKIPSARDSAYPLDVDLRRSHKIAPHEIERHGGRCALVYLHVLEHRLRSMLRGVLRDHVHLAAQHVETKAHSRIPLRCRSRVVRGRALRP